MATFNAVANARAALAALDSSARQLPNPALLRQPALRREAQSTSALEGTYAPLQDVLAVGEGDDPPDANLREILNYVSAAEHAFGWHHDGRPLSPHLLSELHETLFRGLDTGPTGHIRSIQVLVASHPGARVRDARFVPPPPGAGLENQVRELLDWMARDDGHIDPVVAAGMAHYQFETLHPFNDGNGRIGRLLIVLHLLYLGVLAEPTLTVSPWFETRRGEYYDALLAVSTRGEWDGWIRFFANGLASSAQETHTLLADLLAAQLQMKSAIRTAGLRTDNAVRLTDFALTQPIFTVRQVSRRLDLTYTGANRLVAQLTEIGVLQQFDDAVYDRRFVASEVLGVLLRA